MSAPTPSERSGDASSSIAAGHDLDATPRAHTSESQAETGDAKGARPAPTDAAAFSDGLLSLLTPMVEKCDDSIQQTIDSQVALSQQIDRVASELQSFLSVSQLPSLAPHAHRLSEVRRRVTTANATLSQVQARLTRIEGMADRLQAQEHLTLARSAPPQERVAIE